MQLAEAEAVHRFDESRLPYGQRIALAQAGYKARLYGLKERGRIEEGWYADVVVFDPASVQDHATFEDPHQLATGVLHVVVNGSVALRDGEPTGATPGRLLRSGEPRGGSGRLGAG